MRSVFRKTGVLIATLLLVSLLAFLAFEIIPADPVTMMLGTDYTPERAEALRQQLGLDRPVPLRYLEWLRSFVHGDMGTSYSYSMPVREVLRGKIAVTAALSLLSWLLVGEDNALNLFYTSGTPVRPGWIVTWEGIARAVKMILRIVLLIAGTFLLTYTTSPMALTDGMERLLSPLKKLHFPVHEMTLMMSMALRFIPTLIEETDKIMSAQKARGADFENGNLIQRARALLPILVPLFVSAFRRADELAVAMESRCYHGGEGRTRMKQLRMASRDWIALALGVLLLAAVIVLKRFGL